jgi:hypothetical protein
MLALASICAALLRLCCTRRKNTRAVRVHFSQTKVQWQDAWNLSEDARLSLHSIATGCSAILRSVMCATRCFCHVKSTEAPEFPAVVVNASKELVRGRASGTTVCDLASSLGGLLGSGAGRGVILLFIMYKLDYPGYASPSGGILPAGVQEEQFHVLACFSLPDRAAGRVLAVLKQFSALARHTAWSVRLIFFSRLVLKEACCWASNPRGPRTGQAIDRALF